MNRAQRVQPQPPRRQWSLARLVAAGGATVLLLSTVVGQVFGRIAAGKGHWYNPWSYGLTSPQLFDVVRSDVAAVGLVGVGGAALIAYRRQQTTEDQHLLEQRRHLLVEDADLRARYATAAEQLGHDKAAVRLAGVYSLAQLADEWARRDDAPQQQVCIDVLCAYLRMDSDGSTDSGESEVRQTIVGVIRAHLRDPETVTTWCLAAFDFSGANMRNANFTGALFLGRSISFARVSFTGAIALFKGTTFSGFVTFADATFAVDRVDFGAATFAPTFEVSFESATFSGETAHFLGAKVTCGKVSFDGARFRSVYTTFGRMIVSGGHLSLRETEFRGKEVSFAGAIFKGDRTSVVFDRAVFYGDRVSFSGVRFACRRARFIGTVFASASTVFYNVSFAGGVTNFQGVTLSGDSVSFEKAIFGGREINFSAAVITAGRLSFKQVRVAPGLAVDLSSPARWETTVGQLQAGILLPAWAPSRVEPFVSGTSI